MQLVILAGGLGSRISSVAGDTPKSLLRVGGRPLIEHQLQLAIRGGITDVLLCTGYLGRQIEEHVGVGIRGGLAVHYSQEDPSSLLGTGGALVHAEPLLEDTFLVQYGDAYLPIDYGMVYRDFLNRGVDALMCVYRNCGKWDASNTGVSGGKVTFYSKSAVPGEVDYIDYGVTAYRKDVFMAHQNSATPLDLQTIIQRLVKQQTLGAFEVHHRFYEVGSPAGFLELDEHLRTYQGTRVRDRKQKTNETGSERDQAAVFLDRDGVLIEMTVVNGRPKPVEEPSDVRFLPGVREALSALRAAGYKLIVVTNQPDVARGTLTMDKVDRVNQHLAATLDFDDIYVCSHDDADNCGCRKPKPGMIIDAAKKHSVDLTCSFMVGDRWKDVEAGLRAGCTTVLIDQRYPDNVDVRPDAAFGSMTEAAAWILMHTPL